MFDRRLFKSICGGLLLCAAAPPIDAQQLFMGIGHLSKNVPVSTATGISDNGQTVEGDSWVNGSAPNELVSWTLEDGLVSLTPGVYSNDPGGVSGTGKVMTGVFVYPQLRTTEALRWSTDLGAEALGDFPGGDFRSRSHEPSADGDIVVGWSGSANSSGDIIEAFRWTAQTGMTNLEGQPGGGVESVARDISADETVIVGVARFGKDLHSFRWTEETGMVPIENIPGGSFSGGAQAVSADGSVVVGSGFDATRERGFRWTQETGTVPLPKIDPAQTFQRAYATSWDGNVIVGELGVSGKGFGAFYWTPQGGTRWLTDVLAENGVTGYENWHLDRASGISADGQTIVGSGINPDGQTEGWVAYLGPICRADYDKSGSVDADDVAAYLDRWIAKSIFADWNYDGDINTIDLLAFLNEWASGCE